MCVLLDDYASSSLQELSAGTMSSRLLHTPINEVSDR